MSMTVIFAHDYTPQEKFIKKLKWKLVDLGSIFVFKLLKGTNKQINLPTVNSASKSPLEIGRQEKK